MAQHGGNAIPLCHTNACILRHDAVSRTQASYPDPDQTMGAPSNDDARILIFCHLNRNYRFLETGLSGNFTLDLLGAQISKLPLFFPTLHNNAAQVGHYPDATARLKTCRRGLVLFCVYQSDYYSIEHSLYCDFL
jgi:hypothetical protein